MLGTRIQGEATKNQEVAAAVRPVALGLAALFCFLALEDLLTRGQDGTPVAATALVALVLATVGGVAGRLPPRPHWGHPLVFALAALILMTGGFTVQALEAGSNVGLVSFTILGSGMVMYARKWIVAVAGVGAMTAVWFTPSVPGARIQALISAAIAAGLAILAATHRIRVHARQRAVHKDVQRKRRELEESERRYALAMEGASDGLYDWNHESNEVHYSGRWKELLGLLEGEIGSSPDDLFDRIHPDDEDRVREILQRHIDGPDGHFECEFRVLHHDGSYRLALARGASIRNALGKATRTAGSLTDLTGRGVFDPLTGLPNRRLLLDRVHRAIEHSQRGHQDFALLFIDLDRFKLINDTLGHRAGDEVLREVAARLQTCVRASDTVARLGGDEFVLILEQIELPDGAHITIDRILKRLGEPFHLGHRDFYVAASIGVVLETRPYTDADALIGDADTAMYQAKSLNKEWALFDNSMKERSTARLQLETELRTALDRDQFRLEYQPFISLVDESIEGYEALVRWDHPERGAIAPGDFIPTLEETGLINRLGAWVLREACSEMQAKYPDADDQGRPTLSVNVSRKQLQDVGLIRQIEEILDETGFSADRLRLEITETAIIEEAETAIATLGRIKKLGIEVMMDDFGTGHSSLGALGDLPIDTLKIDQSFVARLTAEKDGLEVVRTIIKMGSHLGLKVIAEGIETEEQLQLLKESACPSGQGYLLARPARLALKSATGEDSEVLEPVAADTAEPV